MNKIKHLIADVSDALLYSGKGFRKKGRKRKKKPPSAADKERRELKAKKSSAKSTQNSTDEASGTSSSGLKSEYLDQIISGPVPCLVLPDLKVHQPELLGAVTSETTNGTPSVTTDEASISDFCEAIDKTLKRKKKHSKNPEHKKHKQKHVYKNKRKHIPNVPVFSTTEPLDVSDADVQRKLMAMPSLSSHKFSEPSCHRKMGTLTSTASSEDNESSFGVSSKEEYDDEDEVVEVEQVPSSPAQAPKIVQGKTKIAILSKSQRIAMPMKQEQQQVDVPAKQEKVIVQYNEDQAPVTMKQEKDSENLVQYCDAATSVCMSDSFAGTSSLIINKPIGTSLLGSPMTTYVRKDILKAPRLSVPKTRVEPPNGRSSQAASATSTVTVTSIEEKKAVDGLLVLQGSRAPHQEAKIVPVSNSTMLLASPMFPQTGSAGNSQLILRDQRTLMETNPFEAKMWRDKIEPPANSVKVTVSQNQVNDRNQTARLSFPNASSSEATLRQILGFDVDNKPAAPVWDSANQDAARNAIVPIKLENSSSPMHKWWPNQVQSMNDKAPNFVPLAIDQIAFGSSIQIANGPTSLVLTRSDKNGHVMARPYPPGSKGSIVIPVTTSSILASRDVKNKNEINSSVPSIVARGPRPPSQNSLGVLLKSSEPTGRRKSVPTKYVKPTIDSHIEIQNSSKVKPTSIAAQLDNLAALSSITCTNVPKTNTTDQRFEPSIIHVDITTPEPQPSFAKPCHTMAFPNPRDNSVAAIRSHLQSIGTSSSHLTTTTTTIKLSKPKKPAVSKRKPKKKETTAPSDSHEYDLPPPVLSIEEHLPSSCYSRNPGNEVAKSPASCSYPAIPGHITEMLYPSALDLELLQAFNDYWSAQVSHCAVCTTFASTGSGGSRQMPPDWKYCKPTVLPESSPIWVSH